VALSVFENLFKKGKESGYIPKKASFGSAIKGIYGDEESLDAVIEGALPDYLYPEYTDAYFQEKGLPVPERGSFKPKDLYKAFKDEYGNPADYINPGNLLAVAGKTATRGLLGLNPDPKKGKYEEEIIGGVFGDPSDKETPTGRELYDVFQEYEKDADIFNPEGERVVMDLLQRGLQNERNLRAYSVMKDAQEELLPLIESGEYPENLSNLGEWGWGYGNRDERGEQIKEPLANAVYNYLIGSPTNIREEYTGFGNLPDVNYDNQLNVLDIVKSQNLVNPNRGENKMSVPKVEDFMSEAGY
jgi:hypothetical protein